MTSSRRRWYRPERQRRLRRPVISVGNISMGGTGKTPVTALLARWLVEAGERPAVLSRGYGRAIVDDGVVVVSDGQHLLADVERAGDEPLMIARDVPGACVLVCEQRALAGALAERVFDATIHLLDDGFQHLQLARDADIVVTNARDLAGRPMPFGRLREPVSALAAADAVIFDGEAPDSVSFTLRRRLPGPTASSRVVALAGISRPERFRAALEQAGWQVAELVAFGDHHRYTRQDLARVAEASARHKAPVVTTSKDAVRLLPLRPLPVPIATVPLTVTIEPEDRFKAWLFERVRAARAAV